MGVPELVDITRRWRDDTQTGVRVVAFGSSNTELGPHNEGRFNWVSWLEVGLRKTLGFHISVTNTGIGGQTIRDLLGRFDRDVAPLRPHMVVITIGGNDRFHLTLDEYERALTQLVARVREIGAIPVLQTYYSLLGADGVSPAMDFVPWMETKRRVARVTGTPCVDSFPALLRWHESDPRGYAAIMRDGGHLNPLGQAIFGTMCTRAFGLNEPELPEDLRASVASAFEKIELHGAS